MTVPQSTRDEVIEMLRQRRSQRPIAATLTARGLRISQSTISRINTGEYRELRRREHQQAAEKLNHLARPPLKARSVTTHRQPRDEWVFKWVNPFPHWERVPPPPPEPDHRDRHIRDRDEVHCFARQPGDVPMSVMVAFHIGQDIARYESSPERWQGQPGQALPELERRDREQQEELHPAPAWEPPPPRRVRGPDRRPRRRRKRRT